MKVFKKVCFIAFSVIFMMGNYAFAQMVNDRTVNISAQEMAEQLKKDLNLTEEQMAKVIPVFEYHLQERKKLYNKEKWGGNKKQLRQEARELRKKVEAQLAACITPEQLAKWNKASL